MTDLEDFYAEQASFGATCRVKTLLESIPPDDAVKLRAAMADPLLQHTAIERWCRKKGYDLHRDSIGRHRNGFCRCER